MKFALIFLVSMLDFTIAHAAGNCAATGLSGDLKQAVLDSVKNECPLSFRLFPLYIDFKTAKVCFADGGADQRDYSVVVIAQVDPDESIYDSMTVTVSEGPWGQIKPGRVAGPGCAR